MGKKVAIFFAGCMYALFIATFFALMEELLYAGSVLIGIGNAVLWISNASIS